MLGAFAPQLSVKDFIALGHCVRAVAVVAYVQATGELLVQRPSFSSKIGLVKGKIEEGETYLAAAERELYEEAGMTLNLAEMQRERPLRSRCVQAHDQLLYLVHVPLPCAQTDLRPLSSSEVSKVYFADVHELNFAQMFGLWASEPVVRALATLLGLQVVRRQGPKGELTELRLATSKK